MATNGHPHYYDMHYERVIPIVPAGTRVRIVRWSTQNEDGSPTVLDDNLTVPPRTEGTVTGVDDGGTIHVRWDNGARLGMVAQDRYVPIHAPQDEEIPPAPEFDEPIFEWEREDLPD